MAKVIYQCFSSSTASIAAAATGYPIMGFSGIQNGATATESDYQLPWRTPGVFARLTVKITVNSIVGTSTVRLRVAGANGNQSVAIGSAATGDFQDLTNTDTVSAGQLVNYAVEAGAAGTTLSVKAISSEFEATSGLVVERLTSNATGSFSSGSVTRYCCLVNVGSNQASQFVATETDTQHTMRVPGKFQNLAVVISSNARTNNTVFRLRKNTANGNLTITVGSSATGLFEDTSNTDSVVSGDLINFSMTTLSGSQSITIKAVSAEFASDTLDYEMIAGLSGGASIAQNTTNYGTLGGGLTTGSSETNNRVLANGNLTISRLRAYVNANTLNVTTTIRFRKNTANGNQTFTIGAAATGLFEDTTNSDTAVATDAINYSCTIPAGSGSIVFNEFSAKATADVPYAHLQTRLCPPIFSHHRTAVGF